MLLIAALLFPLDVAARRLRLTRGDAQRLWAWVRAPFDRRRAAVTPKPRALGALFAARDRARGTQVRKAPQSVAPVEEARRAQPSMRGRSSATDSKELPRESSSSPEAMTERLKQAKARARKGRSN